MRQRTIAGGALAALVLVACQPMYGAAPERMRAPKIDKTQAPPPPPPAPAPKDPGYVDVCTVDYSRPPAKVKRDPVAAKRRVDDGDVDLARSEKEPDGPAKAAIAKRSLQSYSDALTSDPYHADATLKLAVTYDLFRRKACALRTLERIGYMRNNPAFERAAVLAADRVRTNPQWFAGYRDEAMKAVIP